MRQRRGRDDLALFHRVSTSSFFQDLPFDLLPPILSQLPDRRDWHACTLVNRAFNRAATPLLYRYLDSRIISKSILHHPSATLLKRPDLARYVRHVTETGSVHRGVVSRHEHITVDTLKALSSCKNLESITWIDDSMISDTVLLQFLDVVKQHPLREINIKTHSDLGETVWSELMKLTGLRKISIWCMEGPPRVLQGWSEALGSTLTHLELGRCAGVPPTILISVLSQLPRLKDLRLKGAPASAIPTILAKLLELESLDTEYPGSHYIRRRLSSIQDKPCQPFPALRNLTVRTSTIDTLGPLMLWVWIRSLIPEPSLETLTVHAFTMKEHTTIPRMFILDLAAVHGGTLKHFIAWDAQLTLGDIECVCTKFPNLETLVCSVATPDIISIKEAIIEAKHLHTLKLNIEWIPMDSGIRRIEFTTDDAKDMMLRGEDSRLRVIVVEHILYKGRWALQEAPGGQERTLRFEVVKGFSGDKWQA